jgi:hypothetical protein
LVCKVFIINGKPPLRLAWTRGLKSPALIPKAKRQVQQQIPFGDDNRKAKALRLVEVLVIPPIAKCAMDGAPGDAGLVEENKQLQMRPQVLRLRGSQNAVSHFAQDDKVVGLESKDTTARQER